MEGACLGKEDASGSGARPLQWSQLSVPAVPVIALTTDITLFMWSYCLLDLGTDFLVGNMVFV